VRGRHFYLLYVSLVTCSRNYHLVLMSRNYHLVLMSRNCLLPKENMSAPLVCANDAVQIIQINSGNIEANCGKERHCLQITPTRMYKL
jgi:hypothetical protein